VVEMCVCWYGWFIFCGLFYLVGLYSQEVQAGLVLLFDCSLWSVGSGHVFVLFFCWVWNRFWAWISAVVFVIF